jgi:hypothetical protein
MTSKKRETPDSDKQAPSEPAAAPPERVDPTRLHWPRVEFLPGRVPGSRRIDTYSTVCPGCGARLDFWACEALCHHCGLKFTCDE